MIVIKDTTTKDTYAKLLFPSYIAGLIIGKDGVEISSLMARTNTNIKFSPGRELYPNTQDRVCCIIGSVHNIVSAIKNIFEKISSSETVYDQEILKTVKMIISNVASGIIIGKSGTTIKTIQQNYNVRIQLTNKDENRGLPERTMTITADDSESLFDAFQDILIRLLHDTESDKWKKVLSYSNYTVTNPSASSTSSTPSLTNTTSSTVTDYSVLLQSMLQQKPLHSVNGSLYQQQQQLASSSSATEGNLTQAMFAYLYSQSLMSNSSYFTRYAPVMIDGVNFSIPGSTLATFEVAVPEVMINSVLGIGGKVLTELMHATGARMQVSGAGDYIPGTYNRKLTITGPILAVQSAHLAVMQNIIRDVETYRKQGLV